MSITEKNGLKISSKLFNFINNEVIPGTDIKPDEFWDNFEKVVHELAPINKNLIDKRENIQKKIDEWHIKNKGKDFNKKEYSKFLKSISYIIEEKEDFSIETTNVDKEISSIAGPQLVVPVDNARYALNAANARWGSLYDALYGTDVISGNKGKEFNKERAYRCIAYVRNLLDQIAPLEKSSWNEITEIKIKNRDLIFLIGNEEKYLKDKNQFIAFNGEKGKLKTFLIKNNNLHIEISLDPSHLVGKLDKASISDVVVESAISTIIDNEDSVAAVDDEDKVKCYRNWLGLMKGDLKANIEKNGKKFIRRLNPDRVYISREGKKITLHGRALLLNRNVGHLMTNPAILLNDGTEIPRELLLTG